MLKTTLLPLTTCISLMLITSCGGLPYDGMRTPQQLGIDTGINSQSISHHAACEYGRGNSNYSDAYFYPCIYIDTDTFLSLFDFDKDTKKYVEVVRIPYSEKSEIAIAHGLTGDQLQIKAKNTYLLINFNSIRSSFKISELQEYLNSHGLGEGSSIGYINARPHNFSPTPVTIPIYIPSGK